MKSIAARLLVLSLLLPLSAWAAKTLPPDRDLDGVPDYSDRCPNTPPNVKVDGVGCPIDGDFDGVADGRDKCPGSPFGAAVDADGCTAEQRSAKNAPAAPVTSAPAMEPAAPVAASAAAVQPVPTAPAVTPTPVQPARRSVATPFGSSIGDNAFPPPPAFNAPSPDAPVYAPTPKVQPRATAPSPVPATAAEAQPLDATPAASSVAGEQTPPDAAYSTAPGDHSELMPLLNDQGALLSAIDRRNAERDAQDEHDSQDRISQILHDHASLMDDPDAPASSGSIYSGGAIRRGRTQTTALPPAPVTSSRDRDQLFASIPFAAGKSSLDAQGSSKLSTSTAALSKLMDRTETMRVEVVGHADKAGPNASKQANERAMAVNAYLIGHHVPPGRIKRLDGGVGQGVEIYSYPK